MNIGMIVTPNKKGQIVIPLKIRKALSIIPNVPLSMTMRGKGIYVYPIKEVVTQADSESSYEQILKKTQGAWAGDDWEETRAKRRKIELAASKRRKASW